MGKYSLIISYKHRLSSSAMPPQNVWAIRPYFYRVSCRSLTRRFKRNEQSEVNYPYVAGGAKTCNVRTGFGTAATRSIWTPVPKRKHMNNEIPLEKSKSRFQSLQFISRMVVNVEDATSQLMVFRRATKTYWCGKI